ncbi:MAG: flagellar biosynthetic protein FliO [Solirubrobacteraceae bacterium]
MADHSGRSAAPRMPSFGQNTPLDLSGSGATHATGSTGTSGSIVRTIVGLAIVIAVIYGLSWILRRAKTSRNPATGTGLEQIASLPLGTGRSVSLVRVGSELHLLGVAEHGVSRIRTFTEAEAMAAGLTFTPEPADSAEPETDPSSIARALDALRRLTAR